MPKLTVTPQRNCPDRALAVYISMPCGKERVYYKGAGSQVFRISSEENVVCHSYFTALHNVVAYYQGKYSDTRITYLFKGDKLSLVL